MTTLSRQALIEQLVASILETQPKENQCNCHLLDPKKLNMLIWPLPDPKCPDSLIIKIANQKFIGTPRLDKKGAKYWKVRDFYASEEKEPEVVAIQPAVNQPLNSAAIDHLAKFQQRQEKAQQLKILKE